MNAACHNVATKRAGMTLPEVLIVSGLCGLVFAAAFAGLSYAFRVARAGMYQVSFTARGRVISQKIGRLIEQSKAAASLSNALELTAVDFTRSRLYLDPGDGSLATVKDNRLMYQPDLARPQTQPLCDFVSPLAGEPIFAADASNSAAIVVRFHVGDGTTGRIDAYSETGFGYQGIEVRFSATPRNRQLWIQ